MTIRHAWLQKHATPAAAGGEFHWYPADEDRDVRAACVERMRGVEPPAVLWELAPGRVVWARPFAATAPTDGRRYVGLVLTIAERAEAPAAELLDELVLPPAAPWREVAGAARGAAALDRDVDATAIARVLLSGGAARVGDPAAAGLPAVIAALERWMPAATRARTRRGTWTAGTGPSPVRDRAAELVIDAWRQRRPSAARAWRLAVELAEARGQSVDEVLAASRAVAREVLTDDERAVVPEARALLEVLHAWGRGRLDGCRMAVTLPERLADAIALRVLASLAGGGDGRAPLAEARWHALLPASRRGPLLGRLVERAGSLRELVEVPRA